MKKRMVVKMADGHGGKRVPGNPAPVSGPGRLSRRTDGGPSQTTTPMTGLGYGENADFNDVQSSAPLAASPNAPKGAVNSQTQAAPMEATPLFAPTQRPAEPVTAGASFGPGDTPPQPTSSTELFSQDAAALAPFLPSLMKSASADDAPAGFVRFVRYLRNMQGA